MRWKFERGTRGDLFHARRGRFLLLSRAVLDELTAMNLRADNTSKFHTLTRKSQFSSLKTGFCQHGFRIPQPSESGGRKSEIAQISNLKSQRKASGAVGDLDRVPSIRDPNMNASKLHTAMSDSPFSSLETKFCQRGFQIALTTNRSADLPQVASAYEERVFGD